MKLTNFKVREFRSVFDSGLISIQEVTCLVGKNESGKTALLKALYRLNPIVEEDSQFNVTDDYPRKEVTDYEYEVASNARPPATPIEAQFELEDDDAEAITDLFGTAALTTRSFTLTKNYTDERIYRFSLDEKAAQTHLAESATLPHTLRDQLRAANDWPAFGAALAAAENTTEIGPLRDLVGQIGEHNAARYAFDAIINPRIPKFLYFNEYYQLAGHENIPALIQRNTANTLQPSDYHLLGLINLARLKLEDLMNVKRTLELTNTLEGAGNHLTRQILKYWSQNKHLQMKFDVREAKPEDPLHMRAGVNIWGKVYDSVHWATTELGSRSRGFVWFFSFLAWYEDVKRRGENIILLLDEPGLSLHGMAHIPIRLEQVAQPPREAAGHGWRRLAWCLS
jgi:hypothetical protein